MPPHERRARVLAVITDVLRAAVERSRAGGISLPDPGSPEHDLARLCCIAAVGDQRFAIERRDGWLDASTWNKTALLLGGGLPHAGVYPFGDLYASQLEQLTGSAAFLPADARALVDAAAGLEITDRALSRWLDLRYSPACALSGLPEAARGPFLEAVRRGRFWREHCGLVPKLSARTIGIDFFG